MKAVPYAMTENTVQVPPKTSHPVAFTTATSHKITTNVNLPPCASSIPLPTDASHKVIRRYCRKLGSCFGFSQQRRTHCLTTDSKSTLLSSTFQTDSTNPISSSPSANNFDISLPSSTTIRSTSYSALARQSFTIQR